MKPNTLKTIKDIGTVDAASKNLSEIGKSHPRLAQDIIDKVTTMMDAEGPDSDELASRWNEYATAGSEPAASELALMLGKGVEPFLGAVAIALEDPKYGNFQEKAKNPLWLATEGRQLNSLRFSVSDIVVPVAERVKPAPPTEQEIINAELFVERVIGLGIDEDVVRKIIDTNTRGVWGIDPSIIQKIELSPDGRITISKNGGGESYIHLPNSSK